MRRGPSSSTVGAIMWRRSRLISSRDEQCSIRWATPAAGVICIASAVSPMPCRAPTAQSKMTEAPHPDRLDAEARERAIDPHRSILLQAPAGSGKTTVLTQRFLRLLAKVDEPEEILAITFTRKAAGEMRERTLRALRGETAGSLQRLSALAQAARAHSEALGWNLLAMPGRLRIQT